MSLLANSNAIESGGYNIDRSLRCRSSASAYLSRTPASATNRKTWTWSGWVKRGALGAGQVLIKAGTTGVNGWGSLVLFNFTSADVLRVQSNNDIYLATTQVFRDPSAWYHVVLLCDTTQATATNRLRMFVNGVEITAFSTDGRATYISQNSDSAFDNTVSHEIGRNGTDGNYLDGYLAEVNFIDGQALTPSSFGEFSTVTGVWQPKKYTGTYGTNGFILDFKDNTSATTLAYDKSGNGNNWTPNNISTTAGATYDSMTDVPTLTSATAANYCVNNPLDYGGAGGVSNTNGNLQFTNTNAGAQSTVRATIGVSSGKWYWETTCQAFGGSNPDTGIVGSNVNLQVADAYVGYYSLGYSYGGNGQKRNNNSGSAYGASYTSGDVIGIALDMDAGTLTFYKNNVSQGTAFTGLSGSFSPAISGYNSVIWQSNFGQRPFQYTPPTGFKALNTFNLPDSAIKRGDQYFNIALDTGPNIKAATEALFSGSQYLEWIKDRANANNHQLLDTVRGTTAVLQSNTTSAETTYSAPSGNSVGWAWKESATAGFDIVTYTGTGIAQNISHNLGVAPKMIIVKARNTTGDWQVYTSTTGQGNYLLLNSTAASAASSTKWNNTAPTSSVFSVGIDTTTNMATTTYVAYLFAEIAGFSKFGSYTGNGSTDGPFVYCGFRPKYVMIKSSSAAGTWTVWDSTRSTSNSTNLTLAPNNSNAENSVINIDLTSNGFKLRHVGDINVSSVTSIFCAFAENPFKYSLAR